MNDPPNRPATTTARPLELERLTYDARARALNKKHPKITVCFGLKPLVVLQHWKEASPPLMLSEISVGVWQLCVRYASQVLGHSCNKGGRNDVSTVGALRLLWGVGIGSACEAAR